MKIRATALEGVCVAASDRFVDQRGMFARCYCENELSAIIGGRRIVQINLSRTRARGAVRGLHFQQAPFSEMKLVRCIRGRIWDVALDLRAGSTTFLRWHAEELTPDNGKMLVIPEGCAHGFQVLEEDSELLYLHTACYRPESEGGVPYNDPIFNIHWPLEVTELSDRDRLHPFLDSDFKGVLL